MECVKNSEIVKLIVKLKNVEKEIIHTSQHLRGIRVSKGSSENFSRCLNLFQEGCSYFFQVCGFLKSQYYNYNNIPSSKAFLINNLYTPSYKTFLVLRQTLASVKVDEVYSDSFKLLLGRVEDITNSLSQLQTELREI